MRAVLTYHSVDSSGSPVSLDEATFERHVAFLASSRVRVVGLAELLDLADEENALAVTFDDGFANFATAAWPHLRDAGLPVTLFLVSRCMGGTNSWGGRAQPGIPELPLMDWDTAGRLADEGVTLGAHSRTHPHLDGAAADVLVDEVAGCKADIAAETGTTPWAFCYPYGDHDGATIAATRREYGAACTTELRVLETRDDVHALPRLDAFYLQRPGRLEGYGTRPFHRHVRFRALLRDVRARAARTLDRRSRP